MTISPGVYEGVSNRNYRSGPGISKSGLDLISRSPAHYRAARDAGVREATPDQRIGTIAHALILEPESFWTTYARPFEAPAGALATADEIKSRLKELGEKISGSKSELSDRLRTADPAAILLDDARETWAIANAGRETITADELAKATAIRDAVMEHPAAGRLLDPSAGRAELSCYWTDVETGVLCRCRPDFWRHDGIVVDLKTARDASPAGFAKSIAGWRYHVQEAFYRDGIAAARAAGGVKMPAPKAFVFVAVEKSPPYAVAVYALGVEDVEIGRAEYQQDLEAYAEATRSGVWPGYGDKIQSIGLPAWKVREFEEDAA